MRIPSLAFTALCFWSVAKGQTDAVELPPSNCLCVQLNIHHRLSNVASELVPLGSSILFQPGAGGDIVGSRILSDPARSRYLGYEVVLGPQNETGSYLLSFRDLDPQEVGLYGAKWTYEPPLAYPMPRMMRYGERVSLDLGSVPTDGRGGNTITDDISLDGLQPGTQSNLIAMTDQAEAVGHANLANAELRRRGFEPIGGGSPKAPRVRPVIDGSPRTFTAVDAELRLVEPSLVVNGERIIGSGLLKATHGSLIYLFVPGRGRYIISLLPRPELGFRRAGTVSGGSLSWAADGDEFSLNSVTAIAPSGPFFVYGMHDPTWQPSTPGTQLRIFTGSVDPAEIRSLQNETVK
jgi:hypothetical protein